MSDEETITPESSESSPRTPYRQCAPDHFRIRMHVSYDGTDFSGWQRQTKQLSIQGTLEAAVSQIFAKPIRVLGASRTDAGVHANQQTAHFDVPKDPSGFDFRYAIQCLTPPSIVVRDLFMAPRDFHAIACVTDKTYKYRVLNRRYPSALRHRYTHWVRFPLALAYLQKTAEFIVGKHDFKSFQTSGTPVQTTIRQINEASWSQFDEDTLEFTIRGDGFLKQMVRNIVGTMIDLNQDGEPPERIREIMELRDRRRAGPTAPPEGLFLYRVHYPESIDNKCRKL